MPFLLASTVEIVVSASLGRSVRISENRPVDQFFSQQHNLRNGHVSTSPLLADNPAAVGHFGFSDDQKGFPSDTPAAEIHSTVISKECQSLAEVSRLKNLRPREEDFKDDEPIEDDSSNNSNSE